MCAPSRWPTFSTITAVMISCAVATTIARPSLAEDIDFSRQIRPILSDHCFACHGPDENTREGGFRLDEQASAFGEGDSGIPLIVPGKPEESELLRRIQTDDEGEIMPPVEHNKPLDSQQVALIEQWISQGAQWTEHWSFIPPQRPTPPMLEDDSFSHNEIDRFVLRRLRQVGLQPNPEAAKAALLRRVTLDLTGLPPTWDEVQAFVNDSSPDAYEKVVDRLLKSPRYGEHMARFWLDAARYGDTHGLHLDNYREMWPYRDWVVNAFNSNMPYNVFIRDQLAGDLVENPTEDQLIATGFNRCHVTTSEGGSIAEEVKMRNVVDRVVTTGTVFMGLTLDCTRCHDHKFDPLTMKDFYSLYAFFNNIDGNPLDGNRKDPAPVLKVFSEDDKQKLAEAAEAQKKITETIRQRLAAIQYQEPETVVEPEPAEPTTFVWIEDAVPEGVQAQGFEFVSAPKPVFSGEKASTRTATGLGQHLIQGASKPLTIAEGDVLFSYVYLDPENPPKEVMLQFNDGSWEHRAYWGGNHIEWGADTTPSRLRKGDLPATGEWVRLEVTAAEVGLAPGAKVSGWAFTQFDGTVYWDQAGIVSTAQQDKEYESFAMWLKDQRAAQAAGVPENLKPLVNKEAETLTEAERQQLLVHFLENVYVKTKAEFAELHTQLAAAKKTETDVRNAATTTLIYREKNGLTPAHILNRGEYDQPKDEVSRSTPAALPPLDPEAPVNRLGLADWLTRPDHPLTARVTVNRYWQQLFGTGLVKTAEDFGSQGEPPSHPQLLDWLAVELIDSGWDVKSLMKQMVMSATYRQSTKATPELLQRDPNNRLLARGPRFRLDAEMLRDQALFLSGLLVEKQGGPSVKPPQPDGLWFAVGYSGSNTVRFKADAGPEKVHRRTLYTFVKRTSPPPQMSTFDAPSREACVMRRERTNTPLQALLLLNDPQYFEAARALGQRVIAQGGSNPAEQASWLLRSCTLREPTADEVTELTGVYESELSHFRENATDTQAVLGVGEAPVDESMEPAQQAAWTIVANLVLNLDEVLNKN